MNTGGASRDELLLFTRQFSFMISSRLPLVDVLTNLAKETYNASLRKTAMDLVDHVSRGRDLADAMANHPHYFDDVFIHVVRSGLSAGRLDISLEMMATYLEGQEKLHAKIRKAVAFPLFMLAAIAILLVGIVNWILPNFERVFLSMGADLPRPTRILIGFAHFLRQYGMELGVMCGMAVVVVLVFLRTDSGRLWWDRVKLHFPVVGKIMRQASLARFLRTFAVQIKDEVDILQALQNAAGATNNRYIQKTLWIVIQDIRQGISVSDAFRKHDVFEGIVMQMISSGEEAGELSALTYAAAVYFERLFDNRVDVIVARVNPIMTLLLSLLVVGVMLSIFLPIFELGNAVRSGQTHQITRPK
ncbi:MAG: type II secretion system F family protein [Magnetococcales bacterium]|nr:type II secretion system F family protein [Magnetococcales bacterium]MBF0321618.1 type II secretion system F family protein [Magnetococcales bacterium]